MLNEGQQRLFDSVVRERNPITICLSVAGSGKTFATKEIVDNYNGTVVVTALSHKACASLNETTGLQARTVHSYLQMVMTNVGYSKQLVPKVRRDGTQFPIEETDLLVVDEISMMNTTLFDRMMTAFNDGVIKQLLLLGDLIQLDAIGGQPDLLKLPATFIELTEQMRQSDSSPELTTYFTKLRSAIANNQYFDTIDTTVPEFTYYDSHAKFADAYHNCTTDKLIIAYRNNKIDKYNSYVHHSPNFAQGDKVIIDKPLGSAANQTTATIASVLENEPTYYKLRLINAQNEQHDVFHFTHKQTMNEQLEYYKQTNDPDGYHRALDQCFSLKYHYACTITKAQGTTVSTVFIDASDIIDAYQQKPNKFNNPITRNAYLRYMYVALSRMRVHAHIFIGNTRNYTKFTRRINDNHT